VLLETHSVEDFGGSLNRFFQRKQGGCSQNEEGKGSRVEMGVTQTSHFVRDTGSRIARSFVVGGTAADLERPPPKQFRFWDWLLHGKTWSLLSLSLSLALSVSLSLCCCFPSSFTPLFVLVHFQTSKRGVC